jgi:hypothetical protein
MPSGTNPIPRSKTPMKNPINPQNSNTVRPPAIIPENAQI